MSDLVQLMDAMGISGAHQVVLKASITSWKRNPDAAFQALAAAKVETAFYCARCKSLRGLALV